jgi:Rrf2 family protein
MSSTPVPMRVSAKTEYALRATAELAAANGVGLIKAEQIAQAQSIPLKFLLNIMNELRQEGIVRSQRGAEGGYRLARAAESISLAEVIRAVEGPLSMIRDAPPGETIYSGAAEGLRLVWIALQATLENTLEGISLADLVSGALPSA